MVKLTTNVIQSLQCGKVFKNTSKENNEVNSMDFSDDGEFFVTSSDDEAIRLYSCQKGSQIKEIHCNQVGADLIKFTHHNSAVVCASKNLTDHTIRYLSLHDNRFIRYFKGHKGKVVSLDISPFDDSLVSCAMDDSVRFWDLGTNVCKGILPVKGKASATFDPKHEHVICVACPVNSLKFYDNRHLDKGPFMTHFIDANPIDFGDISFAPSSSRYLLLSSSKNILIIDPSKGSITKEFNDLSSEVMDLRATSTPDENYIICGAEDGTIHFWEISTGKKVHTLGGHAGPVANVLWNPKYMMMASACSNVCFWIPTQYQ